MKRFLTLIAFCSVLSVSLYAQPTVMIPEDIYNAGESICVPVNVKDFTDITTMNFSITWDTSVVQFNNLQIQNPVFNNNDYFNTSLTDEGILSVTFTSPTMDGATIMDGGMLVTAFELCFDIISPCGTFSPIAIGNSPQPILVTRANTGTTNIGLLAESGLVSVCVSTLMIYATSGSGDVGDEVCIDFSVENFTDMLLMQYTISWDPTVMEFSSIGNFNLNGLSNANFGDEAQNNLDNGNLTLLWEANDLTIGETLADFTTIFQVCFTLTGNAGSTTVIGLTDVPTPIQAGKIGYQEDIGLIHHDGRVFINSVDGTSVLASQETVLEGEDTCVQVTVRDFIDMTSMQFNMTWNPAIISFTEVNPTGVLPGILFNEVNTGTGMLGAEWIAAAGSSTLDNNVVIFDVCFTAVGELTQISPFDFDGVSFVNDENESFNNGVAGSVEVVAKDLILSASQEANIPNEQVCVEFTVENFENILDLEFSVNWETAVMTLDEVGAFNLPGLDESDFNVSISDFGTLTMDWADANNVGVNLPPGSVIFKAFFTIVEDAEIGDCSPITFDGLTTEPIASTPDLNGEPYDLNVVTNNGEVCVLDPNGYSIRVPNRAVNPDEAVCVDFIVTDFENVINTQFSINWDESVLTYDSVSNLNNLPNLTAGNFGDANANNGVLTFGWTSDDLENGTTVLDNTTIFSVCFTAVGESLECTEINITGVPNPVEIITAESDGNSLLLNNLDGEVCINDGIVVVDTLITNLGCEGVTNGTIQLVVEGGEGPYQFLWSAGDNPMQNPVTGLDAGLVSVTILDQTGLSLQETYEIMVTGEAPMADAGDNAILGCGAETITLDASNSTTGEDITFSWSSFNGGQVIADATTATPTVRGAAIYVLTLTNETTTCSSQDTVEVAPGIDFNISAGLDQSLQCETDTVSLSGTDLGMGYEYQWTTEDGGVIFGDATQTDIQATATGTYIFEVIDTELNCSGFDTVLVDINNSLMANAGDDDLIPCANPNFILSGSAMPAGNYDYAWVASSGGNITAGEDTDSPVVDMPGTYTLTVINPSNGCTAQDVVEIGEEPNNLVANAGAGGTITCTVDTLNLADASGSTGLNIVYQWVGIDGGSVIGGDLNELNPSVISGGTYIFVVRDTMTGCERRDEVVVAMDTISPMADAGDDTLLPCNQDDVQLDASGSTQGDTITYTWSPAELIDASNPMMPIANQPGLFELTVTNENNGCTATDVVNVNQDDSAPTVIIAAPDAFGCDGTELVQLDATESTTGTDFTYEWFVVNGDGEVLDTADPLMPNVTAGGTYQLVITNATGCSGVDDVQVQDNTVEVAAIADVSTGLLSCNLPELTLEGDGSSIDGVTYQWTNLDTGNPVTNGNQINAIATEGGQHELMVTHTASGCSAQDTVNVIANFTTPDVSVVSTSDLVFDCPDTTIQLQATIVIDDPDANVSFAWNASNGGSLGSPANEIEVTANTAGTYEFIATVFESGCQDSMEVVLEEFMSTVEINIANPVDSTTCLQQSITIDASQSVLGTDDVTILWEVNGTGEILSGGNTLTPVVTGNTIYTLTLTDPINGCVESQDVIVMESGDQPDAIVTALGQIDCDNTEVTLDATGSSEGGEFEFAWNPLGNGNIVSGENTLSPQVNVGGLYELVITNTATGCIASDTVQVDALVDLPLINAGVDDATCGDMFTLSATLPDTASGMWTTLNGTAIVMNPLEGTTEVTDLVSGENTFIWTQSVPACPDYASDTITIVSAPQPIANNDSREVTPDNNPITFDIVANDILANINNWNVELISQPTTGEITRFENGEIDYKAAGDFSGIEEFEYILCSEDCPDQCDTATVRLLIERDPDFVDSTLINTPNAITPNGDGMNDAFIFDVINDNPQKYPDSELIIFNRWGDIVYKAQPYLNNWEGNNETGNPLPHGTYYYILRLSIYEGEVLRGDVTILK